MAVTDVYMLSEYGKRASGRIYNSPFGQAMEQPVMNTLTLAALGVGGYFVWRALSKKSSSGSSMPAYVSSPMSGVGRGGAKSRRRSGRRATPKQAAARNRFKAAARKCKGTANYKVCMSKALGGRGKAKARRGGRGRKARRG